MSACSPALSQSEIGIDFRSSGSSSVWTIRIETAPAIAEKMNKTTVPVTIAVFMVLEEESKTINEVYKPHHRHKQAGVPNRSLPAQSANRSECNADLKHRHSICKPVMVLHAFAGPLAFFVDVFFQLVGSFADFLLLAGISLGLFLCLGCQFGVRRQQLCGL